MRVLLDRIVLRALAGLAAAVLLAGAATTQEPHPFDAVAVDAYVEAQRARAAIPGVALVVVRGGEILHAAGYGVDGAGAPMTADTPLYVASISKAFTAAAVMQLVEADLVSLDAPVRDYLPEFSMADPRASTITVRQLLDQTSGMSDRTFRQWRWPAPFTLEEAVAELRTARLAAAPGSRWSYHNPNYTVAARLVEVVSGLPFEDYMRRMLFAPLGMADTWSVNRAREPEGMAPGHIYLFGRPYPARSPPFFIAGAGGMISTASDMGRWLLVQTGGANSVLSAEGLADTHAASASAPGYALGWNVHPDGRLSHSGDLAAYSAHATFFQTEAGGGDGLVVLTNAANAPSADIALGVLALMQSREPPSVRPPLSQLLDFVLTGVLLAAIALAAVDLARTPRWIRRHLGRPAWRIGLDVAPQAALVALVMLGIPAAVSAADSWSWIWLAYWLPMTTATLFALALLAALVAAVRLAAITLAQLANGSLRWDY